MRAKASTTNVDKPARKIKKVKAGPKQPRSAYILFTISDKRKEIIEKNPDIEGKVAAIAKKMGEQWKKLTAEEKEPYSKLAAADKIRFQNELKEYESKKKNSKES